jgi:hypothetical protein
LALFVASALLPIFPAAADVSPTVVFLTSGTSWTVPAGVTLLDSVEAIGAAGGPGGGGGGPTTGRGGDGAGGGAYSRKNNLAVTPADSIAFQVGVAGTPGASAANGTDGSDTWFKSITDVLAKGGKKGLFGSGTNGRGLGGQAADGVGDVKYSGGDGDNGSKVTNNIAGAGGGAAGPNGNGANATISTSGGAGDAGVGGAGGVGAQDGFDGDEWIQTSDSAHAGPGGGAGAPSGAAGLTGKNGGKYGAAGSGGTRTAAGGTSRDGLIVITYTSPRTLTFTSGVRILGNLNIVGSLSKGSGTFVIDHPLDPANKLLFHSFVESPDVKNIYDGIATLNDAGEATIELPDYFEALNKDFRYQYFALHDAMPYLYVTEVHDNKFEIKGGKPHGEVSWQITGIRQDPYILKHPITVEVPKGPGQPVKDGECVFPPACEGTSTTN